MAPFYSPVYRPHRPPTPRHRLRWRGERVSAWSRRSTERAPLPWHGQGRLLDFGCGGGVFLERMHLQGWRVTGLDVSGAAVTRIQRDLALPAYVGTLPHPALPPAGFDVITMWHSLEHVHAPLAVLREARRLLAPGGRLLIAVPNIDSLPFRWFGRSWFALDLPRHLTHFSPRTLRLMLERAGLRPGPVRMVRHSGWLRSSAQQSRRDGGPLWHRGLAPKPAARLVTWCCALARRADCIMVSATA
jgi:SAM-dependent methyltransferase